MSVAFEVHQEFRPPKHIIRPVYELHRGDCIVELDRVPDGSVDLVLIDPPYGITGAVWDTPLDLAALWVHLRRILVADAVVLIHCQQPFTTAVVASNPRWFRHEWVWVKNRPTGWAQAAHRPLVAHENIICFSRSARGSTYRPQGLVTLDKPRLLLRSARQYSEAAFAPRPSHRDRLQTVTGYPTSALYFDADQGGHHPTAKPVRLLEYLIQTYTRPGDVVLDPTMGSGSTGVAAIRMDRKFVGIEKSGPFFKTAAERLRGAGEAAREADDSSHGGRKRDPIDVVQERMSDLGLRPRDLEGLLGGSGRVSEILSRRRALTLAHIRVLSQTLGISADLLVPAYDLVA